MSQQEKTALLLINQRSRKGRAEASRAQSLLAQAGFTLLQPARDDTRSYSELIAAYAHRVDAVIVGGGDGTLNAAAPGLMQTGLPLGILPLGTANDFARTLGIPASLESAIKIIADGQLRAVDLGEVNQHLFLNVSSIGFSVELARNLTAESKKTLGSGRLCTGGFAGAAAEPSLQRYAGASGPSDADQNGSGVGGQWTLLWGRHDSGTACRSG